MGRLARYRGVALVTALTFWIDFLGVAGVAVVGAVALAVLLVALALPDTLWTRLTTSASARRRSEALGAISVRIAESDALRDRLFREKPDAQEMRRLIKKWETGVDETLQAVAPEYLTDFRMRLARRHLHQGCSERSGCGIRGSARCQRTRAATSSEP
jgi:hypothetical protein